jgi:topoisomerase-4 subunit A
VLGLGRGGKPKEEDLKGASLAVYGGKRARKGKVLDAGMKAQRVLAG